ncbi:YgaP-like transmembrane domain [Methanimicrococcus blatticola]|uniref:Inner membrane protein YgaP-like transmembrane domain-containing protein n=1 Tax=Methanimicrococcus blatticola TaxID=91560 RepID=A0A484F5H8_9EURY|nr:YgaP-like transmembrane domain [Methanimicrococcus blatticola]MBZ3936174.1 DUF2892 domain-containing protein [Methanimicrococcus blatticola]MCC2508417.1 DUF2892 domain-containing protein [Methanimicrococcus blatticola]TDQ70130.1 hypothetical protein C7391_0469 [Methanimicrococcus blatticola]
MIWMILERFIGIPGLKTMTGAEGLTSLEPNVGKEDRMIRFVVGIVALIGLVFIKRGFIARYLLGLAALAGLTTAYMKFSPVYALIGENTRKKGKGKGKKNK